MYTIIPLTTSRLGQAEAIENACFPDPWSRQVLERSLTAGHAIALGALDGAGVLAGYVIAGYVLDEGCIDNVAVRPDLRRQGIASLLLSALRRTAQERGLAALTLEVRASNLPAQALYARHGFLPVGRRRNYYQHPREDAILMTLALNHPDGAEKV